MHKFKVKLNKEKQNEKVYYTIIHIISRPTLREYTFHKQLHFSGLKIIDFSLVPNESSGQEESLTQAHFRKWLSNSKAQFENGVALKDET